MTPAIKSLIPYDIPFLALSDSSVNGTMAACERKLELRKLYGHARNEHDDTIPTGAGHALHAAYQTWLATQDKEAAIWAMMERYPIHLQTSSADSRSLEACYSTFEEMLLNPIDGRYQLAFIDTPYHDKPQPAVEVPFRITFDEVSLMKDRYVPIYWDGFIDAILWDTLMSCYVVMDIKTTRKSRVDYTTMFKRDPQCLPYAFVLEKILKQPATSLEVLYFVCYIDPLEPRATQYTFMKSGADIQAWAFDVAKKIQDLKMYVDLGFFPKRGKSCDTWGPCVYTEVCDYSDPDLIRQFLDLQFGKRDDTVQMKPWFEVNLTIEGV